MNEDFCHLANEILSAYFDALLKDAYVHCYMYALLCACTYIDVHIKMYASVDASMKHEFVNTHKAKANFTFIQTFTFTCIEEMLFKEALTPF